MEITIEPQSVIIDDNGKGFRPFLVDNKVTFYLDMNKVMNNPDDSQDAIEELCKNIGEYLGVDIPPIKLSEFIQNRKIII